VTMTKGLLLRGRHYLRASFPPLRPSINSVYLRESYGGAVLGDGRIAVVGVFDLLDRHLSFDDTRVGAGSSGGEQFVQDFGGDASGGVSKGVRGKNPGGWRWCAERPGVSGLMTACPGHARNRLPPNASAIGWRSAHTEIRIPPGSIGRVSLTV